MKNTISVEQLSTTGNLFAFLISRKNKLDLMSRFMEIKCVNPGLRQNQIAKELGCPSSTLQRYRNDINVLSPYAIPPNSTNKRRQKISNTNLDDDSRRDRDVKTPEMTSKDLEGSQLTSKEPTIENKNPSIVETKIV